jgi:hypothetical protein
MATMRHPLQGVGNIVRFNWHFYLIAVVGVAIGIGFSYQLGGVFKTIGQVIAGLVLLTTVVSLLVSWYVYDYSDLYSFNWLKFSVSPSTIVNIHAGFDETSLLLAGHFPEARIRVLDFYDPTLHTEVSIKRARAAYPPHPATESITTAEVPLSTASTTAIFVTLSAHEIRNSAERTAFFRQLKNALKPGGQIIVTEHLRDTANFLAYSLGFFHFLSKSSWLITFKEADLVIAREHKITPFITSFTLTSHGTPP